MEGDTVVFTEGINDLAFLKELHFRADVDDLCDEFDNEQREETQTKRIRQHHIGESITYLYKCEGGRSKVEGIYAREGATIGNLGLRTILMLDMDDDSNFSDVLDSLNSSLWEQWDGRISLDEGRTLHFSDDFMIKECTLEGERETLDNPVIITFYNDMETATGMPYGVPETEKRRQARQYFEDNPEDEKAMIDTIYR